MPVSSKHPQYAEHIDDWTMMLDALAGERAIKNKATGYLPKTSGMVEAEAAAAEDGGLTPEQARQLYNAYKARAVYPLWVKDSLRTMMGLVAKQELTVELPPQMADLENQATADGFSLKQLWERVVSALLTTGRAPLLADFDDSARPYVAEYSAASGINWREGVIGGRRDLILAVFEEQRDTGEGDEFEPRTETAYRVLSLTDGAATVRVLNEHGQDLEDIETLGRTSGENTQAIDFLPVVYVGTTDNSPDVDEIPLLTMAQAALKSYQLSADYFTSLHYTGHPQPVVTGLHEDTELKVTGPMAAWVLPEGGDAKYMEFSGPGIEKTREAMQDQRAAALEVGARVLDVGAESGEARKARQDDQHSTLYGLVKQATAGIEQLLRYQAAWMGLDPERVVVSVEPSFSRQDIDAALFQILANLRLAGEIPRQVVYEAMRKAQVTDLSDDELDALNEGGDLGDDLPAPTESDAERQMKAFLNGDA